MGISSYKYYITYSVGYPFIFIPEADQDRHRGAVLPRQGQRPAEEGGAGDRDRDGPEAQVRFERRPVCNDGGRGDGPADERHVAPHTQGQDRPHLVIVVKFLLGNIF